MSRIIALIFWVSVFNISTGFCQFEEEDNRILNEFIVMLKPGHTLEALLQDYPHLKEKELLSHRFGIYLLERGNISSADDFLLSLRRSEHIKLAQFNHRVKERSVIPNDSYFNLQWNMLNTGQAGGIAGADIDATEAWEIDSDAITVDGDTLVVAVVDGNFDIYHQDINYFINYGEIDSNGIDDDANGYIDDRRGWNVALNSGNVHDTTDPHSTHVAGIVGAKSNNNQGVAGTCSGVKILPVNRKSNNEADVVKAYTYVYEMRYLYNTTLGARGAYIVAANSSFGVNNGKPIDYPIWCSMYDLMGTIGIVSTAATANININVDVQHDMPTECPSNWLITVTNTTRTNQRNTGSAYGPVSIDLGAPGTGVYSTTPKNLYAFSTGTSMAAPHVAGTIACMFSAACPALIEAYHLYPDSISLLMKDYLLDGVEWNSTLDNLTTTAGILNLYRAISNVKRFNCDSCHFNISIDKAPISCASANDGAMAVLVDTGSIFDYQVNWSTGQTDIELLSMGPGFYSVTVRDSAGCRRYTSAELHNPDTIVISGVNIIPAYKLIAGNITIVASAGNEPLLYSIDGINYQPTATFSIPFNGPYTVYVKNTFGCVSQRSIVVSGIDDLDSELDLQIYPNPADNEVIIHVSDLPSSKISLMVYDIQGKRIVESIPTTSYFKLQTSDFPNGVYLLRLGNTTRRLVVMH